MENNDNDLKIPLVQKLLDVIRTYADEENWYFGQSDPIFASASKKNIWIGTRGDGFLPAHIILKDLGLYQEQKLDPEKFYQKEFDFRPERPDIPKDIRISRNK